MEIRAAAADDAQRLAKISSATYRSTYRGMFSKDSWLDFATPAYFVPQWKLDLAPDSSDGPVLVAVLNGQIVGFIAANLQGERGDAHEEVPDEDVVELKELYVLAKHQRSEHQVGTNLLYELVRNLNESKLVVGHAASKNAEIRKYMASLKSEEVESGSLVLFRHATNGKGWKVEVGRVSFYWKARDLRDTLAAKLAKPKPESN